MATLAPPPPPMGGPPPPGGPPLPTGLPPPSNAPSFPMQIQASGPPMNPRIPYTNSVLLTNVPTFLHSLRSIRDWLYPCGSARAAIFYPRKNEDEPLPADAKVTILVTMSHADGAMKFLAAFKHFASHLDERYNSLQAYMVPVSPGVPLPPPFLDQDTTQVLGDKLWANFVSLESPEDASKTETTQKLDVTKVAAAAGGGNYDADEDPLNAPQVLEAVKDFRRKLEKTQSSQKKRRIALVQQKLAEMRPRVQVLMEQEKNAPPLPVGAPPPLPTGLAAPPLPPGLPPPPLPEGAAPSMAEDSGKRGRSNLPAWMTQQQQGEESTGEPTTKKAKTTEELTNFPSLPDSTHTELREFLQTQIKEYVGEEDTTLIDFLQNHIVGGKAVSDLLSELQMVLEEEANVFLQQLWTKVEELQQK